MVGDARSAKVAVIAYEDFYCPFCRSFSETAQPALMAEFVRTGRVLWVFRHLPITNLHPKAPLAAALAHCAGAQGRFWEAHDALFAALGDRREPYAADLAAALGLDEKRFADCIPSADSVIRADSEEAARLGIRATPTFLIGALDSSGVVVHEVLVGAVQREDFARALERSLEATSSVR
jgi:protein-disulfide isomerase